MKNYYRIGYYAIIIFFLVYHIVTLSISPIVWTDEVTLTSVAVDFLHHGTFYPTTDLGWVNGMQTLAYGPVYFIFDAFLIKLFGNNIFTARLTGLFAGFILIIIYTNYLRKKKDPFLFILIVCILLDVFFISSMHRGRNDTLSILFYYSSLFVLLGNPLYNNAKPLTISKSLISGILFTFSILTTVRTGFLAAPFAIIFLIYWHRNSYSFSFIKLPAVWGLSILALYLPWIFWGFGSFKEFFAYYHYLSEHFPYFVGSWFRIPREVIPLFLTFIVAFITGLIIPSVRRNIWYTVVISIIISYFIFVGDTGSPAHTLKNTAIPYLLLSINDSGPYCVIIIPAMYILIGLCLYELSFINNPAKLIYRSVIVLLLIFNVAVFTLKIAVLTVQAPARDANKLNDFIKRNIPSGNNIKVCGDEIYYYAVTGNQNPFHLAISYQSNIIRTEKYARDTFNYDYLVVSKRLEKRNPQLVNQYFSNARLEKIAEYISPETSFSRIVMGKAGNRALQEDYSGSIYKRLRK